MPFELGLAVSLSDQGPNTTHEWRVLEAHPFRIQHSLSDLNGYDVFTHSDTIAGIIRALLDMFLNSLDRSPLQTEADLLWLYRRLRDVRQNLNGSLFRPTIFRQLVMSAVICRDARVDEADS